MKANINFKQLITILVVFLLCSCKKGDPGPPGADGKNGNSNVKTFTFTLDTFYYAGGKYYNNIGIPEISDEVLANGMVNVYWQYQGIKDIPLPYTLYYSGHSTTVAFEASKFNCSILVTRSDLVFAPIEIQKPYKFKVVVTSGN